MVQSVHGNEAARMSSAPERTRERSPKRAHDDQPTLLPKNEERSSPTLSEDPVHGRQNPVHGRPRSQPNSANGRVGGGTSGASAGAPAGPGGPPKRPLVTIGWRPRPDAGALSSSTNGTGGTNGTAATSAPPPGTTPATSKPGSMMPPPPLGRNFIRPSLLVNTRNTGGGIRDPTKKRSAAVTALTQKHGLSPPIAAQIELGLFEHAIEQAYKKTHPNDFIGVDVPAPGGTGAAAGTATGAYAPAQLRTKQILAEKCPISNAHAMEKDEANEYSFHFRRLLQLLKSNPDLKIRLGAQASGTTKGGAAASSSAAPPPAAPKSLEKFAFSLAFLSDEQLSSASMRQRQKALEEEGLRNAMARNPHDDPLLSKLIDEYSCPECNHNEVFVTRTINTSKKEDQSDDPVMTLSCCRCDFLWKDTNGESSAQG